jgi:hypothetical protein
MKVWLLREVTFGNIFKKLLRIGTAKCNMCSKILKTSGNTTNLKTHLKQKHYSILQHLSDEKKETEKPDAVRKKKLPLPLQPKSRMDVETVGSSSLHSRLEF